MQFLIFIKNNLHQNFEDDNIFAVTEHTARKKRGSLAHFSHQHLNMHQALPALTLASLYETVIFPQQTMRARRPVMLR